MNAKISFPSPSRHVVPFASKADSRSKRTYRGLLAGLGAAFLLVSAPALAQTAPDLGAAGGFTVLGTNDIPTVGTVTCTNSTIDGNVGSTFDSITDTGCTIMGNTVAPVSAQVVNNFNSAYNDLDTLNPDCDGVIPITTTTLPPGVYCSAAGTTIGAGVILTLEGNASDVWVFKIGTGGLGAFTGNSFQVVMGGTARACNVYWWTAEGATLTESSFKGTILSGAAFTMTGGDFEGRALATTDATVTDAALSFAGCAAAAGSVAIPTLSHIGLAVLLLMLIAAACWQHPWLIGRSFKA